MATTSTLGYCLRWSNYLPNLMEMLEQLLKTEEFTDVTLWLNKGQVAVKCHKIILAACSQFFENIFANMATKNHADIVLSEITYEDIKPILDYVYKGEINIEQEQLQKMLKTANYLKIKGLVNDNESENEEEKMETTSRSPDISTSTSGVGNICDQMSTSHVPETTFDDKNQGIKEEVRIPEESSIFRHVLDQGRLYPEELQINPQTEDNSRNHRLFSELQQDETESSTQRQNGRHDSIGNTQKCKEWKKYKKYSAEDLNAALKAIQGQLTLLQASKKFNIPSRTLYDKAKKMGIHSKVIRRSNSSAAFPSGIRQNVQGHVYSGLSENEYESTSAIPISTPIENPSSSQSHDISDTFTENAIQDLSVKSKRDGVILPTPKR